MGVEPKIGVGKTPQNGWLIMVPNPMNKWMIWGYHDFWKHPHMDFKDSEYQCNIKTSRLNTPGPLAGEMMGVPPSSDPTGLPSLCP